MWCAYASTCLCACVCVGGEWVGGCVSHTLGTSRYAGPLPDLSPLLRLLRASAARGPGTEGAEIVVVAAGSAAAAVEGVVTLVVLLVLLLESSAAFVR